MKRNKSITEMLLNGVGTVAYMSGWLVWKLKKQIWFVVLIAIAMYLPLTVMPSTVFAPKAEARLDGIKVVQPLTSVQDAYIFTYATKYANPAIGKSVSFLRYQLACLAFKENGFHSNDKCGDGGLACGEYQYHPATYTGFRKIMMSEGLTDHIGSRLNDEDATETTAWAITHGHESDWGPLNLGMCY